MYSRKKLYHCPGRNAVQQCNAVQHCNNDPCKIVQHHRLGIILLPRSHSQRRFPVRPSSDYEDTDDSSLEETPRAAEAPPRDPARIAAITGSTPLPQVIIIYIIIIRVIIIRVIIITPLPQFFTTTVRPSRAISSSGLLSGRNLRTSTTTTTAPAQLEPRDTQEPAGPKTIQPFVK